MSLEAGELTYYTYLSSNILSVNEKLPVSKFQYFGKYIIQLDSYFCIHVSGQWLNGFEKKCQFHKPWNYGARDALAVCIFQRF